LGWKLPQPLAPKVALEHSPQNSAASHATDTRAARGRPLQRGPNRRRDVAARWGSERVGMATFPRSMVVPRKRA